MVNKMSKLLSVGILFFYCMSPYAQSLEKIENICPNLPIKQRTLIAVSSFTNSSGNNKFRAEGLTDMLTNALFNSGCFGVLERKNMGEVMAEQNFSNSNRADKKTKVNQGKLKGAGMLIMGNVTESKEMESGGAVGGLFKGVAGGVGVSNAHLGIVIKIVDAETGMVIESKSFNKKVTSAGLAGGAKIAGVPIGGLGFKSKAMQDAVEKLIIDMVEYIASKKNYAENGKELSNSNGANSLTIFIPSISYNDLNKVYKHLQANSKLTEITKSLENKAGTIELVSSIEVDKIADYMIECKCGLNLEITSVSKNGIEAVIK